MAAIENRPTLPAAASPELQRFAARGHFTDHDGHRVFVVDDAGPGGDAPPVVFVHGFPGSAFDFAGAMSLVARERRALAMDLLGYGLSDKPAEMGLSLFEQADVVERVVRDAGAERAHLVAHDMGTSVTLELLARHRLGVLSFEPLGVLFTNGSVFIEMSQLTPSQKLLRLPVIGARFAQIARFQTFAWQIDRISGRRLTKEQKRDMFELMTAGRGRDVLPKLIGYIAERYRFAERWVGHLDRVTLPVTVLWGQRDPVAVPEIGERLARALPNARIVRLDDVGHFSPNEAPEELAREVLALVARAEGR